MHSDNPNWPITMIMENISSLWAKSESMNYHSVLNSMKNLLFFSLSLDFSNCTASAPVALWDSKVSQSCILQNPADVVHHPDVVGLLYCKYLVLNFYSFDSVCILYAMLDF